MRRRRSYEDRAMSHYARKQFWRDVEAVLIGGSIAVFLIVQLVLWVIGLFS